MVKVLKKINFLKMSLAKKFHLIYLFKNQYLMVFY